MIKVDDLERLESVYNDDFFEKLNFIGLIIASQYKDFTTAEKEK